MEMKITKRILAMVLAAVLAMGMWQTVLASELIPRTATVYVDGQATTLGDTLHVWEGWHFVEVSAFAEVLGFDLQESERTSETRGWVEIIVADSARGDVYTGAYIPFGIEPDFSRDWSLTLHFAAYAESYFPYGRTAFGPADLFLDFAGTFVDFDGIERIGHWAFVQRWDVLDFNIDDERASDLDTVFPRVMIVSDTFFMPLEIACWYLDYSISTRNGAIHINTADSSLGIRPRLGVGPVEPTPPFTEQPSSWAVEQVNAAIAANLVPQNLQSNYTQATTRAEFAALAVYLYENQRGTITGRSEFADTNDVNVQKAAYIGVVQGVGNNRFAPNDTLTREQAAVMLARLANAIGQPLPPSAPPFADNAQVSDWATQAVGQMQASGIMGGVGDNRFAPSGDYTREQSIVTIMRLFEILE
jgi:hypothetical protein